MRRNEDGLITALVLPSGKTLAVESDRSGHTTPIETLAGTLRYAYRGNRLVKFTDTAGSEIRYTYDAQGRMTEWYDAANVRQVKNTYDKQNRVTHQIDAGGGEYGVEYFDDHTVTTDADGNRSEIWFDAQKRTTKTVDANGAEIRYAYDERSNIIAITDALGNATRYEYDAFGNKVKETAPDGSSYSLQYDANNNLTQLTDQRGGVTRYEYDAHNRLVRQTNPDGGVIAYTYNDAGQVLTVTDPLGHVTAYEYDGVDLVRSTDPNGNATSCAYDEQHRLVSTTDALGNTTAFAYDERDNLTSVTFADGTSFSYEYDKVGDLISQTDALGNVTRFEYDALRQLVKTIYPDGSESTSSYDHSGNLVSAVDALGGEAAASYDGRGNLLTLTDALGNTTSYAYDLSGRITQESRTENGATLTSSYLYDALGQLTSFTRSDGQSESYVYDPVGNMTAKTQNGVSTTMRYNAANQLIQSVTGNDTTKYTYDANGNLTRSENAGGARSYAYNALNLLESFTREDGYTETYSYNANRLLSEIRTSEDLTTTLTWDILYGDGVVISAAQNGQTTNYTYGLERISAISGSTRTEYVYDGRASVAAEISYNTSGSILVSLSEKKITSKSYTPFGEQLGEAASGFGYNGEYYNAATGMIYLRARFYEPEMNRFSQKDTLRGSITDGISLNRYLYCQNDPVNFADYNGLQIVALEDFGGSGKTKTTTITKTAASNKPVQVSTNVNPNNTKQTSTQAGYDAKRALDFANTVAPGSAQTQAVRQAYQQAMNYATIARQTNDPNMARLATEAANRGVNIANTLATNRQQAKTTMANTVMPSPGTPNTATPSTPTVSGIGGNQNGGCWRDIHALGAGDYTGIGEAINLFAFHLQQLFGASAATKSTQNLKNEQVELNLYVFEVTSGVRETIIFSKIGDSSKPISVYANGDILHPIKSSSTGLKINLFNSSVGINLALDNISINTTVRNDNKSAGYALKLDLSKLKVGIEQYFTESSGDYSMTAYTNYSISGIGILSVLAFLITNGLYSPDILPA